MRFAASFFVFTAALGCGDGVGRPIVERSAASSGADSGGSAGAGSGGAGSGGAGETGDMGGRSSTGGFDGRGFGARGWIGDGSSDRGGTVPESDHCASVAEWPSELEAAELSVFEAVNVARAWGVSCTSDSAGEYVPPLFMAPELRCAARLHARDMDQNDFFSHVNPAGAGPEERIRRAGFDSFRFTGESIAHVELSGEMMVPSAVIAELRAAGGEECENLVDPRFLAVGVGRYGDHWTLDFAGP